MRSLSLESIPANKKMKLQSLLITLLALSYASSDMTVKTFSELLHRLEKLENHTFNALSISEPIQTPRDVKNACECKDLFAERLKHFLVSVRREEPKGQLRHQLTNILDNLKPFPHPGVNANDNCNFTTHNLKRLTSDDMKKFIQDNIEFIQNWNAHCKQSHKSN